MTAKPVNIVNKLLYILTRMCRYNNFYKKQQVVSMGITC